MGGFSHAAIWKSLDWHGSFNKVVPKHGCFNLDRSVYWKCLKILCKNYQTCFLNGLILIWNRDIKKKKVIV